MGALFSPEAQAKEFAERCNTYSEALYDQGFDDEDVRSFITALILTTGGLGPTPPFPPYPINLMEDR